MTVTLSSRAVGVASVIVLVASAAPALAQRQAGPFAGVLGGNTTANARHGLTLDGSLFGAWDDILTNVPPSTAVPGSSDEAPLDDRFLRSGGGAGATGGLTHVRSTRATQWQSSASTSMRLYGGDNSDIAATFAAYTGGSRDLGERVSLTATGGWSYAPYYSLAPEADLGLSGPSQDAAFALATAGQRNTSSNGSVGVGFNLSRRDTLSFSAMASRYDFLDLEDDAVTSWGGFASYSRELTRSLKFVAGIGRTDVGYDTPGGAPVVSSSYTLGLDYADALSLSFSRRTSVSFSTSSSVVNWNSGTHFRLNGSASLTHVLNRTSTASVQYVRGTDFDAGFRAPLLSDSLSGGVSTQLGLRASVSGQASFSRGSIGFEDDAGTFKSYSAGGSVTVAMTRRLGVFGSYSIYRYEVPAGAPAVPFLPALSRQSVTGGLNVWLPLINDARTSSDTR
jgi:hypothetical protein